MELFDKISNDIKEAMKAKDKVALDTLRNIKKVLLEAKTAPGANDTVSDETAIKLIQKLVKQGKESAELYNSQNRPELAAEELAQVAVMERYLPAQMSEEEVKALLLEKYADVIATKNKGMIMKTVMAELKGKADGKVINKVVADLC